MKKHINIYVSHLAFLIVLFSSCGPIPKYLADKSEFHLQKVEINSENKENKTININDLTQTYSDSLINIKFMIHPTGLKFKLGNKNTRQLKINWNECSLKSHKTKMDGKIIHYGTKYIQSTEIIPPSVIPQNDSITDMAIPTEFVNWISRRNQLSSWKVDNFINITSNDKNNLSTNLKEINKYKIRFGLQVETDKKITDYLFTFDFKNSSNVIIKNPSNIDEYYSLYSNNIIKQSDDIKSKSNASGTRSEKNKNKILSILTFGGVSGILLFSLLFL